MSEFSITSADFEEGGEIPKKFGYKHGNEVPLIIPTGLPVETGSVAIIMDDPDAMKAVGKVWVHYLTHFSYNPAAEAGEEMIEDLEKKVSELQKELDKLNSEINELDTKIKSKENKE